MLSDDHLQTITEAPILLMLVPTECGENAGSFLPGRRATRVQNRLTVLLEWTAFVVVVEPLTRPRTSGILSREGRRLVLNWNDGFGCPHLLHRVGEGSPPCGPEPSRRRGLRVAGRAGALTSRGGPGEGFEYVGTD